MIFYSVLTKLKTGGKRTLLPLSRKMVFAPKRHDDHVYSLGVDADHECHHSVLQNLLFLAHDSDLSLYLSLFLYLYLSP
jgi:hypothetical protein